MSGVDLEPPFKPIVIALRAAQYWGAGWSCATASFDVFSARARLCACP